LESNGFFPTDTSDTDKALIRQYAVNALVDTDGLIIVLTNPYLYGDFTDEVNWERIYLPTTLHKKVLNMFHDNKLSGHRGVKETYLRIQERFSWPKLHKDVEKYVQSCETCQIQASSNKKLAGLMTPSRSYLPFDKIGVDFVGPFPRSTKQNTALLVITCAFSGWTQVYPLRDQNTTAKTALLKCWLWFCTYGFPSYIVSDNGSQFISELWRTTLSELGLKIIYTSPYHPQSNHTERKNKDIKAYIRKYISNKHNRWDENLESMCFSINNSKINSTGYTPFEIIHGRKVRMPFDLQKVATEDMDPKQKEKFVGDLKLKLKHMWLKALEQKTLSGELNKIQYDKAHRFEEFKIGQYVLKQNFVLSDKLKKFTAKLAPRFVGPYIILEAKWPLSYVLGDIKTKKPVEYAHVSQLKLYIPRQTEDEKLDVQTPKPMARLPIFRQKIGKANKTQPQ